MSNMEWKDTDTDQMFVHSDHRPIYSSLDIYTGGQFDDDFPKIALPKPLHVLKSNTIQTVEKVLSNSDWPRRPFWIIAKSLNLTKKVYPRRDPFLRLIKLAKTFNEVNVPDRDARAQQITEEMLNQYLNQGQNKSQKNDPAQSNGIKDKMQITSSAILKLLKSVNKAQVHIIIDKLLRNNPKQAY